MNFRAFLLILSINYGHLIFAFKEVSEHENCSLCTISFFRRKRALPEYTRWRSNPETTQEFIVKVLEDDITTPRAKVVAVNIRPNLKDNEKIIIGGATLISTTAPITPPLSDDYTRFVPPTTLPVTRYDDMILAPATTAGKIPPIKPKSKVIRGEQQIGPIIKFSGERHSLRDESPPSGPKFIPRPNAEYLSQYAPIAPVVFTQKTSSLEPLTPRTVGNFRLYKTSIRPTRTPPAFDMIKPIRTPDFRSFLSFDDGARGPVIYFPTRTTHSPEPESASTSTSHLINDIDEDFIKPTSIMDYRRKDDEKKAMDKLSGKDGDDSYNMLIYDDDGEITTKHVYHSFTDTDDDKTGISEIDFEHLQTKISLITDIDSEEYENSTKADIRDYNEEEDIKKGTVLAVDYGGNANYKTTKVLKETVSNQTRKCNLLKLRPLSFSSPRTLHEITSQLRQWAEVSPVAKWVDITDGNYTVMENPIYMMIVDDPSSGQIMSAKQTVMIVAGIQGRDHHAVAAAMYVLYQLIDRTEAHADLLTRYRFWIIPVFNPDGYDYSMTFPRRREWSKNLRQTWDSCKGRDSCQSCELYGIMCTIQPCHGVNLDRNFEYQWIPPEELRSEHPCGALYAGPRQLSEAETRALTHYLHEQKSPLYTFIAFKEGDVLRQRASRASAAAYSISGRPYVAGQTSEFLPLYAGGIEDWVDSHLGIDNTYTVMMFRPTDSYNSKLLTERIVHEAYAAVDTLLLQSVEPLGPPPVTLSRSNAYPLAPSLLAPPICYIVQWTK
ncbi:unnamed protein product [Leptosia nina]|uniref:Peptidase M14 domain-containing protein n=1 Tax=Leptosia nina TaxID=320188 RepID=A0AAV1JCF7_9NEOP